jgi:NAD(P)H dehydrogenase (quinone)
MIIITGASGKLGRHVVDQLVAGGTDRSQIVATARSVDKLAPTIPEGIATRRLDYNDPATIGPALEGASQVLLISSSEFDGRVAQHKAVIDAAVDVGVQHLAYTSLLKADTSTLGLAADHAETENLLAQTELTTTRLRHGWYIENHTENLDPVLAGGALIGSAGAGRIAAATRADYAAADAAILLDRSKWGGTYELAGPGFTLAELAAAISAAAGQDVPYVDMAADEHLGALVGAGVPEPMAHFLVDVDRATAAGDLDAPSETLAELVGRPLASMPDTVATSLR